MQGGWEADETVEAAAARETVEEAGVRGNLEVSLSSCCAMLCHAVLPSACSVAVMLQTPASWP